MSRGVSLGVGRVQGLRFLAVGASNTLLSYAIFLILAEWIDERLAYTVAFAAGLTYTTVFTSSWVFQGHRSGGRYAAFIGWYLVIWLIGLALVSAFGRGGSRQHLLAAALVLLVTTPINFAGGRLIFYSVSADKESRT